MAQNRRYGRSAGGRRQAPAPSRRSKGRAGAALLTATSIGLAVALGACASGPDAGPSAGPAPASVGTVAEVPPASAGTSLPAPNPADPPVDGSAAARGLPVPGDPAALRPYQAAPSAGSCQLHVLPGGIAALPVVTMPPSPSPPTDLPVIRAPDGARPTDLVGPIAAVSRVGDWFRVGEAGLAHVDPATARVDLALATGGCSISWAATTERSAAVVACETVDLSIGRRDGCAVLVTAIPDGTEIGRWAVEGSSSIGGLALDGDAVVLVQHGSSGGPDGGAPVLPEALRFDPASGAGTSLATSCGGEPSPAGVVIERTSLLLATCTTDGIQADDVIDARDGTILARQPYRGGEPTTTSDGATVTTPNGARYDADTFELLASPAEAGAALGAPSDPDAPLGIVAPGAVWAWRTTAKAEPTGYVPDTLSSVGLATGEIVVLDETGAVIERWPGEARYVVGRGGSGVRSPVVAADATGAWVLADDGLHRIDRGR